MGNINTKGTKDRASSIYQWKIQSFSKLKNEKYESGCFQTGGHDWRMVLYPSGNKQRGVKDYISLYLELCESECVGNGGSAAVKFKLFLLDRDNNRPRYFGDVDVDGGTKRFNKKEMQGSDQFISLKRLKKPKYLHKDICTFGVEVFIEPTVREETLSVFKNPQGKSLQFRRFSTLRDSQYSDSFKFDDKDWKILLYPKGHGAEKNKSLSIYLMLCDNNTIHEKFYAEFKLRVQGKSSTDGESTVERTKKGWSSNKKVGVVRFMPLINLDPKNGFIENDTLTVEVEILQVSVVKNLQ